MLYHWYELDLNSATAEQHLPARHRLHDGTTNYNALAAIKRARGGSIQSNLEGLVLRAANDQHPDRQVERLRETGLGRICQFNLASHPGVAGNLQQIKQRLCLVVCMAYCSLLSALYFLQQCCYRNQGRRSHKMVANGTEHSTVSSYGAQRQRFQMSVE